MQLCLKMGLRQPIHEGDYHDLVKADKVGDVVVGDLIEINDLTYLFRGMNRFGGPGQSIGAMLGYPTPQFGSVVPKRDGKDFIQIWDLSIFPYWRKTGHVTPKEWETMRELVEVSH